MDSKAPTKHMQFSELGDDLQELVNDHSRYTDFKRLGEGGIGIVTSCTDPHLGRRVAMKLLKRDFRDNRELRTRFVREARVMSQLEHPNIVPVHEMGTRDDNTVYFTMKQIGGVTLRKILSQLYMEDEIYEEKYPLSELLDIFIHVCQAVAFAHSNGVIHRDLKPDNVQLGNFGEILVLDWGLAKIIEDQDCCDQKSYTEIEELLDLQQGATTMDGSISGTPLYMAPEQAEGLVSELDERTDLYSLGVMLYEILTLEQPFVGPTVKDILDQVVAGKIMAPRKMAPERNIPRELEAICMKALATKKSDRYQSVTDLVEDLERYRAERPVSVYTDSPLGGFWKSCKRHAVRTSAVVGSIAALVLLVCGLVLAQYVRQQGFLDTADSELAIARQSHTLLLEKLRKLKEVRSQNDLKTLTREERDLSSEADTLEQEMLGHVDFAIYLLEQAGLRRRTAGKTRLIELQRMRVQVFVIKEDYHRLAELFEVFQRMFGDQFQDADRDVRAELVKLGQLVNGVGSLALETGSSAGEITLWRYEEDADRRLKPRFHKSLGKAPIERFPLAKGSYLLVVQDSDAGTAPLLVGDPLPDIPLPGMSYYPVLVGHAQEKGVQIVIPDAVPDGMVYVAGGPTLLGGDHSRSHRLHENNIPGFFIKQTEVTFAEYLEFWKSPDGGNRSSKFKSRIRFSRDEYRYVDAWDRNGNLINACKGDRPVVGVTWKMANAYCEWLARTRGRPVRLPTADEWEKAARGVDGREYPWGNSAKEGDAFTLEDVGAIAQFGHWAPPKTFPVDCSVYGVYDMGGNVREWTSSKFPDSPFQQIKGSSSSLTRRFLHCAYAGDTPVVPTDVGFRYVMPGPGARQKAE